MNLKKYFPSEDYVLLTDLSADKINERIEGIINFGKEYTGKITNNEFRMSRVISYRNSFLPDIKGFVSDYEMPVRVYIKMKHFTPVLIFVSLWLAVTGIISIITLLGLIVEFRRVLATGFSIPQFIPLVMFILCYLMVMTGFKLESIESKKFLNELLEAKEIEK